MRSWLWGVMTLAVVGCKAGPTPEPVAEASPAPHTSERTQYELVGELRAALRTPVEQRDAALQQLRRDWTGQIYTWEMHVIPTLCQSPERCNVMPFDHHRFEGVVVQGWLPSVELTTAVHTDLLERCQRTAPCVATFRGQLDLNVSAEEPTSVKLQNAEVVDTRATRPTESWIRRNSS